MTQLKPASRSAQAVAWLLTFLLSLLASAQEVVLTLDDAALAPAPRMGIGVNGGGSWFNFVGANLVDDPSFEGPEDANGFAHAGWPWVSGGLVSPGVDTSNFISGAHSQRVYVADTPAHMTQGRVALPQLPLIMQARTAGIYRIKVQIKTDTSGARVRLGVVDEGWGRIYGPERTVGTQWQVVEWDYVPAADHLLRGISIQFVDVATYWLDDLVAWDTTDIDPDTGLNATFVARLVELRPASLRLGGLGVNGIPLESYLREWWALDYGPPAIQPDLDLNTFLRLCRRVGAQPFITVPPAFSDATHWQVGDLTDEVIADIYEDHGNLIDYLGGDGSTAYGARREAAGLPRWDQQFDSLYLELGNELWGTPDDRWDMDPNGGEDLLAQMTNFATYNQRRMTEMKARPGWRANMKVGFCGRGPTMWMGGWPGSYDGTLVPAIGGLTDFSTIDLYVGQGQASDGDEAIYGGLFATAQRHEREIAAMKVAFSQANGGTDIETTVYEGNATWGGYESDLSNPSPLYFKSVSLGAAVALVDLYAASHRAGVTVNNHFHYGGNVWSATGPYPRVLRKPAYFALKLLTHYATGDLIGCQVSGAETWDDALTGERAVPMLACYPYLAGDTYSVLIVNRHRSQPRSIRIPQRLAPMQAIRLSGPDLNANNEADETVELITETLSQVLEDEVTWTVPAHTAVVLVLSKTGQAQADGGDDGGLDAGSDAGGDEGDGFDAGQQDGGAGDEGPGPDTGPGDGSSDTDGHSGADTGPPPGKVTGSCGCRATGSGGLGWCLILALWALGRRRT